ncbi:PVC-type heme-binding CxxCH protein [Prosthecobacter sp.]|jgi:putative membrane-bound dehydrogenase-like protein|uniref:PVC-type heme-binding CxxCH protein n=1 Tax=Prosthecobacter sp. TaxID=1965333 RepID=UPI0037CA7020
MQRRLIALLVFTSCAPFTGWSADELKFPTTPPTEPQNAAKTFHVLDGFQMQLIAAEPLVTDPVAITYDEDGRAYVCEMNDYPYTDKEHHKHAQENPTDQSIGKVRLLTDTDGDGIFDKATVFAEGLSWPTGAACWKGGIFVTATPDVWYLKDTNGDGVADVRQKVFTGFKKLNVQAVMNNPIWGLDHRIYIAGGSNGGEIQRAPGSESVMPLPADFKPLSIKRNDFSFDPSTGDVRLESGGARFGNTFDDWGNRFLCNIRNPCQHVVLPYRYLARNPYLVVPSALNDCAEAGDQLPVYRTSPPEPWREFRAKRWVQEGSTLPKSELVGAGVVTSSAGITVYRGDAYPPEYRDFVFVADVAGNLFYRMKLVPDGVTFKAVQVDGNKNFCTSDDLWSRPVNFVNAPDGCLHVCDMYREVIEHPWSIPDDIHSAVDLLRGRDKGRIYRLAPKSFKTRATPKLSAATTTELVALLDHPNAWHRESAQRLLFERQDKAAVEPLRKLLENAVTSQGKAYAVHALNAQLSLTEDKVIHLLTTADSHIRRTTIEAVSSWPNVSPKLQDAVLALAKDASPEVRMYLSFLFSVLISPTMQGLDQLVLSGVNDTWQRRALLSMPPLPLAGVSVTALKLPETLGTAEFLQQCLFVLGSYRQMPEDHEREDLVHMMLSVLKDHEETHPMTMEAGLTGLSQGLAKHGLRLSDITKKTELKAWLASIVQLAAKRALDEKLPIESRQRAARLLSLAVFGNARDMALQLLAPETASELQQTALEVLGGYQEPAVANILIESWPKLTPPLRDKAVALLLSRTDRIAKLLDAIESKKILPSQLSAATKATLGRQKTPALAERIAKIIGDGGSSNRKEVITKYEPVLSMTGDTTRGTKIYETLCMVCHRHLDRGNDVGPNLGTIKAWTAEQILTNVLDPNREVSPNFALYIVETNDGRTLSGLITSETAGNLTLKRADGGTDTVLRSEIKSLTSPGISLMPEGLEAAITPQQMADLIAYLKH